MWMPLSRKTTMCTNIYIVKRVTVFAFSIYIYIHMYIHIQPIRNLEPLTLNPKNLLNMYLSI